MPHFDELYPGRFLKGTTLEAPKVIKIDAIVGETLPGEDGEKAKRILKYTAKDGPGEIVWCKTNAALVAAIHGDDWTAWIGKYVTVHHDPTVTLGGKAVGGIRVCGSPQLKAPKRVEIKRPRRKTPEVYMLNPTNADGAVKMPAQPPAVSA